VRLARNRLPGVTTSSVTPHANALPGHKQRVGEMCSDLIEVVKHGGDRPVFAVPALHQMKEILAGPPIDRGERLAVNYASEAGLS
jgi:hypothetical protein